VNGNGEVWELDGPEASCCAEGHICNYKTLYYSECVPTFRGESPARTQRELDTESEEAITEVWAAMNNFYLIINAQIVFFMQAGFAMLEVGIISPKNAKSILFKNLLDMCTVALTWWMWGFGLAGNGASGQIVAEGSSFGDFGMGEGVTRGGSGRGGGLDWENSAAFLHSLVFATTTTTIMSGGVAEWMKVEGSRGRGE
jgi:Amt family ammonium transporter